MAVARQYEQPRRLILGAPIPGPGEPLFTDEDREWAVEYERYLARLCHRCGEPPERWENVKPGELPKVGVAVTCRACEEIYDTEEEIPEAERKPYRHVVLVPGGMYDRQQELAEAREMLAEQKAVIEAAARRLGVPAPWHRTAEPAGEGG